MNLILNSDSYKFSMHKQYPPNTEYVYSYIESRGGEYDKTLFFGLQSFIKEYLLKPITLDDINEANELIDIHLGTGVFNREGWEYILNEHGGYLPVQIDAAPEGLVIPVSNVLLTITNTDPKCFWLPTFLETSLLRAIWYPTTVATRSYFIKQKMLEWLEVNGTPYNIDFNMVDFGSRGVSSYESSQIGGAAHLVNFQSTDNVVALKYVNYQNLKVSGLEGTQKEPQAIAR